MGEPTWASNCHGGSDAGGDTLGIAQGDLLGHQFAQDQRQIGDDDDDEHHAQHIGDIGRDADGFQPIGEAQAQRGAGKGAGKHPNEGNADLDRGQELAGVFGEAERDGGALVALVGKDAQARRAGGYDRQFGHRQRSVDDGQNDDNQDFYEQGVFTICGPALSIGSLRTGDYKGNCRRMHYGRVKNV